MKKKIFLSESTRPRALLFGMWASTKFVQIIVMGLNGSGGQIFYIDLHRLV